MSHELRNPTKNTAFQQRVCCIQTGKTWNLGGELCLGYSNVLLGQKTGHLQNMIFNPPCRSRKSCSNSQKFWACKVCKICCTLHANCSWHQTATVSLLYAKNHGCRGRMQWRKCVYIYIYMQLIIYTYMVNPPRIYLSCVHGIYIYGQKIYSTSVVFSLGGSQSFDWCQSSWANINMFSSRLAYMVTILLIQHLSWNSFSFNIKS